MSRSSSADLPFAIEPGGLRLAVRVTPRAKKNAIAGIVRDPDGLAALAIRLAAPPVDGAANKALCAFLADALGVSRSKVSLRSGETARRKILVVAGDGKELAEAISRLIGP